MGGVRVTLRSTIRDHDDAIVGYLLRGIAVLVKRWKRDRASAIAAIEAAESALEASRARIDEIVAGKPEDIPTGKHGTIRPHDPGPARCSRCGYPDGSALCVASHAGGG
jgi:hypothetical protein